MKKSFTLLTSFILLAVGNYLTAQCSFTGLDTMYCADGSPASLVGTPAGGEFSGAGVTGDTFDPVAAGPGEHTITYEYEVNKANYYLRSTVGEPWGSTSNVEAMDLAFGPGEWSTQEFETLDPAAIFSDETGFIFIDGSDNGATELTAFLATNLTTIENWVNDGGRLLMNAAPNEGGDIAFGFGGSTLEYDSPSSSVDVVDLTHPAYLGPNTPTAVTMTGSSYSHAHISGTGFTNVLVNSSDASNVVLCEKAWGAGHVMLGGMTTSNYHSPATEANNWRANIIHYMSQAVSRYYLRSTASEPWGSTSNPDAMNLAFGMGQWSTDFFETLDPAVVFSTSTSFVFMDGSDAGASELTTFLTDNMETIEDWVASGGSLLINAAPNEGGDIDFGFDGSVLNYELPAGSVNVVDLTHPAYIGPNSPTAATMTGSSYAHAHITGTGFTNLLVDSSDPSVVVLCEKVWGNGVVMMGGMTTSNYHSPATEANNWRANLMVYLANEYDGYLCTAEQDVTVLAPMLITATTADELLGGDGGIDISVTGGLPDYTYDWDNDGTGDFDDTEDLLDLASGMYTITVEDEFGCTATETFTVGSQVNIQDVSAIALKLYPNPTQDMATIEFTGTFTYQVFDLNGKLLLSDLSTDKTQLDFSNFENGIYFVQVSTETFNKTIKVVKK